MEKKFDISWKDALALIVGYFIAALCVGAVFMGIGYLRAKGVVGEGVFAQYEIPIAIATFLGFAVGGAALASIRVRVAIRNASVLLVAMIVYGIWRGINEEGVDFGDIFLSSLQIGGGLVAGAWIFCKLYYRHLIKKYYPEHLKQG